MVTWTTRCVGLGRRGGVTLRLIYRVDARHDGVGTVSVRQRLPRVECRDSILSIADRGDHARDQSTGTRASLRADRATRGRRGLAAQYLKPSASGRSEEWLRNNESDIALPKGKD